MPNSGSKPAAADAPPVKKDRHRILEGVADLQAQLDGLGRIVHTCEKQITDLICDQIAERQETERTLREAAGALQLKEDELARRQSELEEKIQSVEQQRQQINQERARILDAQSDLENLKGQFDEQAKDFEQQRADLEARRRELEDREKQLQKIDEQIDRRHQAEAEKAARQALADLEEQRQRLAKRDEELAARQVRLARQQKQLQEWQDRLSAQHHRLVEADADCTVRRPELVAAPSDDAPRPVRPLEIKTINPGKRASSSRRMFEVMVLVLAVGLGGAMVWHQKMQQSLLAQVEAVQQAIREIESVGVYHAGVGDISKTQRGFPKTIEQTWFDELPVNTMVGPDVPWLDIAPPEHSNLINPPSIVADERHASFWYNPGRGIVRARVPRQLSQHGTADLYNRINGTGLLAEQLNW